MSKLELEEEIKREVENNLLVEVEKSGEINWEEYIKDMDRLRCLDRIEISYNFDNEVNLENLVKYLLNLYEDLKF